MANNAPYCPVLSTGLGYEVAERLNDLYGLHPDMVSDILKTAGPHLDDPGFSTVEEVLSHPGFQLSLARKTGIGKPVIVDDQDVFQFMNDAYNKFVTAGYISDSGFITVGGFEHFDKLRECFTAPYDQNNPLPLNALKTWNDTNGVLHGYVARPKMMGGFTNSGLEEQIDIVGELTEDLGGEEEAQQEIKDTVAVAKKGKTLEEALAGQESFFSDAEKEQIKIGLGNNNLQVMSVSRLTDPAFFSQEIVAFLKKNAQKPLSDPSRVLAMEIWSKHDGLPMVDILEACKEYRVAPMVSFSITGLGGTALEGGVMKYQDMLDKVGELVQKGILNPVSTTIRIDPILVGETNMDDIRNIVKTAKSFGIKKFVTSLVQSYGYTEGTTRDRKVVSGINNALATEGRAYDWDKYYGRDRNGKINFKPKQQYIDEVGKVLLELDQDPEISIQTCAFGIKSLKVSACLDPMIIERIVGVDVTRKDGTYQRDTSRPECMCYGCHGDFFKGKSKKCYSSCAYCYAAHSGDNKLSYYDEKGNLKDFEYTKTSREELKQLTLFDENDEIRDEYKGSRPLLEQVVSGVQTGVDTIGLIIAKELGIKTGGWGPPGFVREKGQDKYTRKDLEELGVKELPKELQGDKTGKEFYLPRTEQNVIDSDATVYFNFTGDKGGLIATKRYADAHGKPFLLNPDAAMLREFLIKNQVKVLNVAGNRGSKLTEEQKQRVEQILRSGLMSTPIEEPLKGTFKKVNWSSRPTVTGSFEVSTAASNDGVIGDARFSALNARFAQGTTLFGHDVSGMSIEDVYQKIVKKSGKGQAPAKDSILYLEPSLSGNMTFAYGKYKRPSVKSYSTIEAIRKGERTATTRYESDAHIDYWKNAQVGDIISFKSSDDSRILVRVTKPLTKLDDSVNPEEWSKKEGWSVEYFETTVRPKLDEAYQMEYEYLTEDSVIGREDYSYRVGYLPLWQVWASQNQELMMELAEQASGKTLVDRFASKNGRTLRVNQARALSEILNEAHQAEISQDYIKEKIAEELRKLEDDDYRDAAFFFGLDPSEISHAKAVTLEAFEKGLSAYFKKVDKQSEEKDKDTPIGAFRRKFPNKNMLVHMAESLVRQMSNIVNELQDDEKVLNEFPNARKIFGDKFRDVDFTKLDRKEILMNSTYFVAIRNKAASRLFGGKTKDPAMQDYFDMFFGGKTKEIDNLSLLMQFGKGILRWNEGIRILEDGTREVATEDDSKSEEEQEAEDSYMDGEGNGYESDEQYKLADDIRRAGDKVTQRIKIMLSNIEDIDLFDGEYLSVSDPFGLGTPTYIATGRAVNTLLNVLNGADSIDIMIDRLKENIDAFPWFKNVLSRIEPHQNESVSREKLRNEFFASMRKDKTVFSTTALIILEDGTIMTRYMERNRGTGSRKNKANIVSAFDAQENLGIFKNGRIDFEGYYFKFALNRLKQTVVTTTVNGKPTLLQSKREPNIITMLSREYASNRRELYQHITPDMDEIAEGDELQSIFTEVYDAMQAFGIEVTPRAFYAMAMADLRSGKPDFRTTNIGRIMAKLNSIAIQLNNFRPTEDNGFKYEYYNPMSFNRDIKEAKKGDYVYIASDYDDILEIVGEFTESPTESMAYVNHRAHYAFNYPTFIQSTIAKLSGRYVTQKELNDFFSKRYDNEWYSYITTVTLPDGTEREERHYYIDILEQIKNVGNIGGLEYMQKLDCDGIDYKFMSPKSYALSIMSDYFDHSDPNTAIYRAPIASDKPAMDTIRWRRFRDMSAGESNYQTVIGRQIWRFVLQEVKRSRSVLNDALLKKAAIANYNINPKDPQEKAQHEVVMQKIIDGQKITASDLFVNRKYIYAKSGVGFKQVRFMQSILENTFNTGDPNLNMQLKELRAALVDAIFNNDNNALKDKFSLFQKAFENEMDRKVQSNINYLNDIGLLEIVKKEKDVIDPENDVIEYDNSGEPHSYVYKYKFLQSILSNFFYEQRSEGEVMPEYIEDLQGLLNVALSEFVYNNYTMQIQMCELFGVDLAYYDGTTDFQKRMAQTRSTGQKLNKDATIFGKRVSDGIFRTITLGSIVHKTAYETSEIEEALNQYAATIKDVVEQKAFIASIPRIIKLYEKNDATDGQAWNCLSSLRKKHIMAGKWTYAKGDDEIGDMKDGKMVRNEDSNTDEAVYRRIIYGIPTHSDFFHVFTQVDKPFVYDVSIRNGKPVPIQQKNSEYTAVIVNMFTSKYTPNDPLSKLIKFMEDTYTIDPLTGIDTANFDSAIKVGNSKSIDMEASDSEFDRQIREAMFSGTTTGNGLNRYNSTYVTRIDSDSYAYQQSNPEHFIDHRQLLGSQERILSVTNTRDDDQFGTAAAKSFKAYIEEMKVKDPQKYELYKHILTDDTISGKELKDLYFGVLAERTKIAERLLRSELRLDKPRQERFGAIAKKLKHTLSMNRKYSIDDVQAVTFANGNFLLAAEDPNQADNIKAATASWVKKAMYKQEVLGGPVVQTTNFGKNKRLKVVFENGKFSHFQTIVTMPEQIRRILRDEDGNISEEYFDYKTGEWKFDAIKNKLRDLGALDMLNILLYRIPSEGKYSIFPCKIIGFAKDGGGSVVELPDAGTTIAGFDFDIDKLFAIMKEYATKKDPKTGKVSIATDWITEKAIEYTPSAASDYGRMAGYNNVLFDLQWMSLTSQESASEIFDPGNFQDLTDLSYRIELMRARDPYGRPAYTLSEISKMSSSELKSEWTKLNDMDPADFETMIKLHDQNMSSKEMLGIAAVANIAHAQMSMFTEKDLRKREKGELAKSKEIHQPLQNNLKIAFRWTRNGQVVEREFPYDKDLNYYYANIDQRLNMEGEPISRYTRKYVGAAADAAKNPTLSRLGADKVTFPIIQWFERAGAPADLVHLYMALPVFRRLSLIYKAMSDEGNASIPRAISRLENEIFRSNRDLFRGCRSLDEYIESAFPLDGEGKRLPHTTMLDKRDLIQQIYNNNNNPFDQIRTLEEFKELYWLSQNLTTLSNYGRINSVIVGPRPSIEENESFKERRDKVIDLFEGRPKFTEITYGDLVRFMPYETQMYKSIIELLDAIQGELFPSYQSESYQQILSLLSSITHKTLSVDMKKRINEAQKLYALSLAAYDLGGQDFYQLYDEEQAKHYFLDFPSWYARERDDLKTMNEDLQDELDDNALLQQIGDPMAATANCPIQTLNTSIFGADEDFKYKITQAWMSLLSYQNEEMLPEQVQRIHNFALELFRYFTLRNRGRAFDAKTPLNLAPLELKTMIPGYNDRLKSIQAFTIPAGEFVVQFLLNNAENDELLEFIPEEEIQEIAEGYVPNSASGELKIKPEYIEVIDQDKTDFLNVITDPDGNPLYARMSVMKYIGDNRVLILGTGNDILNGGINIPIEELPGGDFVMKATVPYKVVHRMGIPGVIAEYYPYLRNSVFQGLSYDPENPVLLDTDSEDTKLTDYQLRRDEIEISAEALGYNLNEALLESASRLGIDTKSAFTLDKVNSRVSKVRAANMLKLTDKALLEKLGFKFGKEYKENRDEVDVLVRQIRKRLEGIC